MRLQSRKEVYLRLLRLSRTISGGMCSFGGIRKNANTGRQRNYRIFIVPLNYPVRCQPQWQCLTKSSLQVRLSSEKPSHYPQGIDLRHLRYKRQEINIRSFVCGIGNSAYQPKWHIKGFTYLRNCRTFHFYTGDAW